MSYKSGKPSPAAAAVNRVPAVLLFLAVAAFIAADLILDLAFNGFDYAVVIIIALFGFKGYLKGLINTVFSLGSYIVGLVCAYIFSPKLALLAMQKTSLGKSVAEKLNDIIPTLSNINAVKINETGSPLDFINSPSFGEAISINPLLKQILTLTGKAAETGSMYSETVVTVNDLLVYSLLKIIALVVLFFAVKLVLVILGKILSSIFNSTAILGTANRSGGMAAGFGVGLLICYVVFVFTIPALGSLGLIKISESYAQSVVISWLNGLVVSI